MTDYVTLAGGCFWCTEAVFKDVIGVESAESGYIGGHVPDPTYKQVCGGDTGHAEAIRIGFDPEQLKLGDLLDIFFATHDATTLNRQGNDVGTQYRSGIYITRDDQREVAQDVIREIGASGTYRSPIVTEVVPLADYSTAEAYHQDYFLQHPNQGYCAFVVGPKVEKFQKTFAARVKG